jgi:hypothetical protein
MLLICSTSNTLIFSSMNKVFNCGLLDILLMIIFNEISRIKLSIPPNVWIYTSLLTSYILKIISSLTNSNYIRLLMWLVIISFVYYVIIGRYSFNLYS